MVSRRAGDLPEGSKANPGNRRKLTMINAKGRCQVACTVLMLLFAASNFFGQEGTARVTVFGGGSFLSGERLFNVGGGINSRFWNKE